MRFYPDITHNVRCEYPVNFLRDDWHFAYAATLSRESINPRPTELLTLHRLFSPYTVGSVSYSEGAHDDVNKAIWSALEFNPNADLRTILLDYCRYFLFGADESRLADCIFMLEKNWQSAPEENPVIDFCHKELLSLGEEYPSLKENWRYLSLYFRACCDKLVRERTLFELQLIKDVKEHFQNSAPADNKTVEKALQILSSPFKREYSALRAEINALAEKLFRLIGIQLDVEHYCADSWERGATLETIDNNVTDRAYLSEKLRYALTLPEELRNSYISGLFSLRTKKEGQIYYSVALHGLDVLGIRQEGEFYMDVYADKPFAKEKSMPMGMTKLFDHFSFRANFGGFSPDTDYSLRITYKTDNDDSILHHKVTAGGRVIYDGKQFGGNKNEVFDKAYLVEGFESATYLLPSEVFKNGTLELLITEETQGFKLCELWIEPIL